MSDAGGIDGDAAAETAAETAATAPVAVIGVLALQGAFSEHESILRDLAPPPRSVSARQVRTPSQLFGLRGLVLPGGESTAMGLIGSSDGMWDAIRAYVRSGRPVWGTCAGMILLADRCVGASAVITDGQALIGGVDALVCRNYFGSQIRSFEMPTPPPPGYGGGGGDGGRGRGTAAYPGVFIRAPAILSVGPGVEVLGRVVAAPCRQAAAVLRELESRIEAGEDVVMMGVVDALSDKGGDGTAAGGDDAEEEEKKESTRAEGRSGVCLPVAAEDGTDAREVICALRSGNVLCTAFHPELTGDVRWHEYFVDMVREDAKRRGGGGERGVNE